MATTGFSATFQRWSLKSSSWNATFKVRVAPVAGGKPLIKTWNEPFMQRAPMPRPLSNAV
ncbi:hypothetical protein D3C85_1739410 [compost metagenome]